MVEDVVVGLKSGGDRFPAQSRTIQRDLAHEIWGKIAVRPDGAIAHPHTCRSHLSAAFLPGMN